MCELDRELGSLGSTSYKGQTLELWGDVNMGERGLWLRRSTALVLGCIWAAPKALRREIIPSQCTGPLSPQWWDVSGGGMPCSTSAVWKLGWLACLLWRPRWNKLSSRWSAPALLDWHELTFPRLEETWSWLGQQTCWHSRLHRIKSLLVLKCWGLETPHCVLPSLLRKHKAFCFSSPLLSQQEHECKSCSLQL